MPQNPDPDFPRMMFHRTKEPVIVNTQEELEALGRGWGYRPGAADVPEEPEPTPEDEPEEDEPEQYVPKPPPAREPLQPPVHARSKKRVHR